MDEKSSPQENFHDFSKYGNYYIKVFYTNKEELAVICYDLELLDGIKYELKANIKDIYKINNAFKRYNNIKDIYQLIINLIEENAVILKRKANNNTLSFSFKISDEKKNNINIEFNLPNEKCNNSQEYIDILSSEIIYLRNSHNKTIKELQSLKEELNAIKKLINNRKENENENNATNKLNICSICGNSEMIKKCICCKYFCEKCISDKKNTQCLKECYLLNNNLNKLTTYYHISKHPLPKNFEAKIHINEVDMLRIGISFDTDIINEKNGCVDSPKYRIYYKSQGPRKFYSYESGWKSVFNADRGFQKGDDVIMRLKNGEISYLINDEDIGRRFKMKIDEINNNKFYLLIHRREDTSQCEIKYICELID